MWSGRNLARRTADFHPGQKKEKSKIQSHILKLAKISGVISVTTHIGVMLLQRTKLFVARDDFPILRNHRDGQRQTKQALMYFKKRPLMMIGTCLAESHCLNFGSVWHDARWLNPNPPEGCMWVQGRLTKEQITNGQTCHCVHCTMPETNGLKENPNWTRQEKNVAFTLFWMMMLILRKSREKNTGNKEGFSDAWQSDHTSQLERLKLGATLWKWLD